MKCTGMKKSKTGIETTLRYVLKKTYIIHGRELNTVVLKQRYAMF